MYSNIIELLKSSDYNFLRTERHLAPNGDTHVTSDDVTIGYGIIMLGLGGSYAYGTNNENSDVDSTMNC